MHIASAAAALSPYKFSQDVLHSALIKRWGSKFDDPRFLERLHDRVRVETRSLSLPFTGLAIWGEANHHWIEVAQTLGEEALRAALGPAFRSELVLLRC